VIAATNRDLKRHVADGTFRDDLYYRLNVVTIPVPPLRERREDIPLLAQHFLQKYAQATGKPIRGLAPQAVELLAAWDWPGNVRELEHAIERAVALAAAELILPHDLPPEIRGGDRDRRLPAGPMTLEEVKRWYVAKVLEETGGNKARAAEVLGIDRRTLYRMLDERTDEEPGSA
jgi:DNA-binding NtrC family response regulator